MEIPGPSENPVAAFYDHRYGENENLFSEQPKSTVVDAMQYVQPPARTIDIGTGQGRNAIFLAQHGFKVEATDISPVGIDQLKATAQKEGLQVESKIQDARRELEGEYDLVVCCNILHHLPAIDAEEFLQMIKAHTKSGGLNVVTAISNDGDFYRQAANSGNYFPDQAVLEAIYADWELLQSQSADKQAAAHKPDGTVMRNVNVEMIARKPAQNI